MRYNSLAQHPHHFRAFTGVTVEEFDGLCAAIREDWRKNHEQELLRKNPKRKRRIGAGHPFALPAIEEQLLLTLVWAKLYSGYLLLEYLFHVDESTVCRTIKRITPLLRGRFTLASLKKQFQGRKKLRTLDDLREIIPDLDKILADITEQPILKPGDGRKRRPRHSGKKRDFTVKTQIAVNGKGLLVHVSDTVGGRMHDYKLFKRSGLPQVIPKETRFFADLGYEGVRKDYPHLCAFLPVKRKIGEASLCRTDKIFNKKQRRTRIPVENTIAQLKKYQVLSQRYRHNLRNYNTVFHFVANVVNFRMLQRQYA